jgi:hypothetical protein
LLNALQEKEIMPTLVDVYQIKSVAEPISVSVTGTQREIITRYLDTNGSGAGTKDASGDYSGAAEIFYIQPPAGQIYRIARMIPHIVAGGKMASDKYGVAIVLTNGITIRTQNDNGPLLNLTDDLPIHTNTDWARLCYDLSISNFGSGNEYLHARWTFAKSGQMIRLVGDNNERLEVVLNDDFGALVEQFFMVQGYIE